MERKEKRARKLRRWKRENELRDEDSFWPLELSLFVPIIAVLRRPTELAHRRDLTFSVSG